MVLMEVPVMADMFLSDRPFRIRDISLGYCSLYVSMLFRYEDGRPILIPSFRQRSMYCFRPLSILSFLVSRSIEAISKRIVQIREVIGVGLPFVSNVSKL